MLPCVVIAAAAVAAEAHAQLAHTQHADGDIHAGHPEAAAAVASLVAADGVARKSAAIAGKSAASAGKFAASAGVPDAHHS